MRTITKLILTAGIATGGVFAYSKLYKDGQCKLDQSTFQTTHPTYKTIVRKKVFSGNLIPYQEVKVESHVTGIVDKLLVKVGDYVQKGATIARIKVRPNPKEVEAAKSKLRLQSIALNQTRSKYLRSKQLFNKKMLAKEAYEAELALWEQTKEKFASAQKELEIIQVGHTAATKSSSANSLNATIKGTILELPIKEGSMVQGTNEQASATTVAVIGNMDRLLFSAKISELDVVHLKKGMTFTASLNAFHEETFQVTLTKISPKANEEALKKGEIKFEIEGIVHKPKKSKVLLRAGYLALAKVVLERAEHVLAIPESVIHTEDKNYFVKCLSDGRAVKKDVVLGLSDGLYVEVKEGLTETDLLIVEA